MPRQDGFDVVKKHSAKGIKKLCCNPSFGLPVTSEGRKTTCGQCVRMALVDNCINTTSAVYEKWLSTESNHVGLLPGPNRRRLDGMERMFGDLNIELSHAAAEIFNVGLDDAVDADSEEFKEWLVDLRDQVWDQLEEEMPNAELRDLMKEYKVPLATSKTTRYKQISRHVIMTAFGGRGCDPLMGMMPREE